MFKLKSKTPPLDFVALTAHQLKKPLSEMKLSLQMILAGDFGSVSLEQKEIIEKILHSNETAICLITDLLDMAKIEGKKTLYNRSSVDVVELIESLISFEHDALKRKNIVVKLEKPSVVPSVMADRSKLSLAIQNILDNAVKYTPVGGSITIGINEHQEGVEIIVKDSGIGIPHDQHKKLFTKFFRGVNAIKMETSGSGLGLFIAKNIIEGQGGSIRFESEENRGTTFFIVLPTK